MKVLRIPIFILVLLIAPDMSYGDRGLLSKPTYDTDLGDTSRDHEVMNPATGQYESRDSDAIATFDATRGRYDFRFKDENGEWCEAYWLPRSNIDVILVAAVEVSEQEQFRYDYSASVQPGSIRLLKRIMVETLSDVRESFGLEKLTATERGQRWAAGKWVGKALSRDWGRRLWAWERYIGEQTAAQLRASGTLSITSLGLPTPMPCWIEGDGSNLFCSREPVGSIDKLCSARSSILTDAATGLTVAPGLESVELPVLRGYFDTSVEQGWLEAGQYRDQIKALLESALQAHDSGNAAAVLTALRDLDALIEQVYTRRDSPILSEAYALFHFNIAYLLEQYEENSKTTAVAPAQGRADAHD